MKKIHTISGVSISFLVITTLLITSCEKKVELEKFSSKSGRFSVMAPGTLGKTTQTVDTAVGPVTLVMFMINKLHVSYIVGYADYPHEAIENADPDAMLVNARNEMLKKIDGKLISEERIAYDKDPGIEIHYTAKGGAGTGHTAIILSGNRLYQVGAIGAKDKFPAESAKQYIDSFEIW